MAAAIGAGLPVGEPTGNMVVDIGGGTSEVAVISLGGIVVSQSIRIGGDELDDAIINYVKREYKLMIGQQTSEEVKLEIGSAFPLPEEMQAEIRGRDLVSGLPKTIVLTSEEVRLALEEPLQAIVDAVKETLDRTPPELASDIMDRGIMLAGGGALLQGSTSACATRPRCRHTWPSRHSPAWPWAPAAASRSSRPSTAATRIPERAVGANVGRAEGARRVRQEGGPPQAGGARGLRGASIVMLTAYFGESEGGVFHTLQRGAQEAFAPVETGATRALKPFRDLFGWVGDTFDAKGENEDLARGGGPAHALGEAETAVRDNAELRGLVGLGRRMVSRWAPSRWRRGSSRARRRSGTPA